MTTCDLLALEYARPFEPETSCVPLSREDYSEALGLINVLVGDV